MAADRYNWKSQPNAGRLARALETWLAERGQVCYGLHPDGSQSHPADNLVPMPLVPMAAGGTYECAVICLCRFCAARYLRVVELALENIANRQSTQ